MSARSRAGDIAGSQAPALLHPPSSTELLVLTPTTNEAWMSRTRSQRSSPE